MNDLEKLAYYVERGKISKSSAFPADLRNEIGVSELTLECLNKGIAPSDILYHGLIPGMSRVGEKFRENKIFVPDVLIAAKAMNAAMMHLKPFFTTGEIKSKGKIIMGTVFGDLHDIGKKIVSMIFEGNGWAVEDLGVDVSTDKFVKAVSEQKPFAIGLSALLTTTMLNMKEIISEIRKVNTNALILVGGAPLTSDFANSINADFYSDDPQTAVNYLNSVYIKNNERI